jgi:hypothetical protein
LDEFAAEVGPLSFSIADAIDELRDRWPEHAGARPDQARAD